MNLSGMNLPDRKTWSTAASPSNLAMAALVGFLFVGQATDWKILGRKAKPHSAVKFGTPELAGKSAATGVYHSRRVGTSAPRNTPPSDGRKGDPNTEEVADRRPTTRDGDKSQRELD